MSKKKSKTYGYKTFFLCNLIFINKICRILIEFQKKQQFLCTLMVQNMLLYGCFANSEKSAREPCFSTGQKGIFLSKIPAQKQRIY